MNYLIFIIVLVVGIALGFYFSKKGKNGGLSNKPFGYAQGKQSEAKRENISKIMELFGTSSNSSGQARQAKKVTNDDVQALLGISDATATRYLEELEQEDKIQQVGKTGHSVYYTLK